MLLVEGLPMEKPILIPKGTRNGAIRMCKALTGETSHLGSQHPSLLSLMPEGPSGEVTTLSRQWPSSMPSFTQSSVATPGLYSVFTRSQSRRWLMDESENEQRASKPK